MVTRITPLPTPVPQSSDPANFDQRADAFLTALPTFADEVNAAGEDMDEAVDTAQAAAASSLSNAGFVGRWEDQTGPAAPPYSVFDGGLFWTLLRPVASVADSRPGIYNLDWAVSGAPSWYNNFSVGDYLDTARNPGSAWIRRDGAAYPKATYPELAPLMPSIPASFVFDATDLVTDRSLTELSLTNGQLLSNVMSPAGGPGSVVRSSPGGVAWEVIALSGITRLTRGSFAYLNGLYVVASVQGYCYIGSSLSGSFAEKRLWSTNAAVNIAASDTAMVASGYQDGSSHIARTTAPSGTWASIDIPAGCQGGVVSCAKGVFFIDGGPDQTNAAVSFNDGLTFSSVNLTGLKFARIRSANNRIFGFGGGSGLYVIADDFSSITPVDISSLEWASVEDVAYVDGKYVIAGASPSGRGVVAYSIGLDDWTEATAVNAASPVRGMVESEGLLVAVADGSAGAKGLSGRFIDSEIFRAPNDNADTGWIKATSDSAGTVGYAGIPEAPLDGKRYGRRNGTWEEDAGGVEQVNADWNALDGPAAILNKPTIPTSPGGSFVGTTATQTLTNKTLGAGSKESVTSAGTISITDSSAPFQQLTMTANRTATINLSVGVSRSIWINPGTYTVTWPAGTILVGDIANLPASKWSLITFTGMPSNTAGVAALVASQP